MTHRSTTRILAALLVLLALVPGRAARADDSPVAVRAIPQYAAVEQGGRLVIAVEMDHQKGFHSWPAKEVTLPKDVDEFAIRTEIGPVVDVDEKATEAAKTAARKEKRPEAAINAIRKYKTPDWLAKTDGVQYPEPHKGKVADPSGGTKPIEVPLYSGKAVSYVVVEVKPDATVGEQSFSVEVQYQSCDESICTAPQDLFATVNVKIVAKGAKDLGAANESKLFEKYDAKKWGGGGGEAAAPIPAPVQPVKPAPVAATTPMGPNIGGIQIGGGILVLFLVSVIGGVILDLTPCVLPVIPIKVLTLTQHTKSPRKRIVLGLWVAAGVVAFWAAAGLPMALLSASLDPSKLIFGMWWVTLALGLLIAVMGLGIMGLFTISLPQAVYLVNPKHESAMGSFLSGVMTAVLGLPCFGFVAGGLLAGAATLPPLSIMAVFVGIGIGMALPYYILTVWPNLLRFIPRTGPASDLVKQVMGLLLLAGAAFFIAVGIKTLIATYPPVGGAMNYWAGVFFILLASLWLVFRAFQISKKAVNRAIFTMIACCMVGGAAVFAYGQTFSPVPWQTYSEALLDKSVADGKVVVVDFTADWCITCKFLKSTVLNPNPVRTLLQGPNVIALEVDLTAKSAPGWEKMRTLGQTGIPALAIYGPGVSQPIILNAYTSDMVVQAIAKARGAPNAAVTQSTQPAPTR